MHKQSIIMYLFLRQVCRDAQTECNMEKTFVKLRQGWEGRLFQVDKFTLPVWQHCEPDHGLRDTQKQAEAIDSHLCNEGRITITGETTIISMVKCLN